VTPEQSRADHDDEEGEDDPIADLGIEEQRLGGSDEWIMVMGGEDDDVRGGGGHYTIFGGAAGGEQFYVGAADGVARRVAAPG